MGDLKKLKKTITLGICQTQVFKGLPSVEICEEAEGVLYQTEPGSYILAFDSILENNKVTTTIKITQNVVSMVKIGQVHSRQTFAAGQWLSSQFFYGGGSIACRNFTQTLDNTLTPHGGFVEVLYELWSGETHLGYFNLELLVQ